VNALARLQNELYLFINAEVLLQNAEVLFRNDEVFFGKAEALMKMVFLPVSKRRPLVLAGTYLAIHLEGLSADGRR
jgi:hypothetical protein